MVLKVSITRVITTYLHAIANGVAYGQMHGLTIGFPIFPIDRC